MLVLVLDHVTLKLTQESSLSLHPQHMTFLCLSVEPCGSWAVSYALSLA